MKTRSAISVWAPNSVATNKNTHFSIHSISNRSLWPELSAKHFPSASMRNASASGTQFRLCHLVWTDHTLPSRWHRLVWDPLVSWTKHLRKMLSLSPHEQRHSAMFRCLSSGTWSMRSTERKNHSVSRIFVWNRCTSTGPHRRQSHESHSVRPLPPKSLSAVSTNHWPTNPLNRLPICGDAPAEFPFWNYPLRICRWYPARESKSSIDLTGIWRMQTIAVRTL